MNDFRKLALLAAVVVGSTVLGFAQHDASNAATNDQSAAPEPAAVNADAGRRFPAGWSLSAGGSVMEFFDTNPVMTSVARSDNGEQFIGRVDVSNLGKKTSYVASYVPAYFNYRRFSKLNSFSHAFSQNLHHSFSKKDSFNWSLAAQQYPSWSNGGSLSGTSIGGLIMSLAGLSQFDLVSNVSLAQTQFGLNHVFDRRSSMNFSVSGGAYHYGLPHDNPYVALLMRPGSNTWAGSATASYDYRIDKNRTIGVAASHSYTISTLLGDHQNVESLQLRYAQQFQNNWRIAVAVGPSFVFGDRKGPSFDLSFTASHTSKRGKLQGDLQHRFEPGIEPGQATTWSGRILYEYALSRRWVAGAHGVYQQSRGLARPLASDRNTSQVFLGTGQLGYRLRPNVTWFANYGYSLQSVAVTNYIRTPRQQISTGLSFELDGLLRQ